MWYNTAYQKVKGLMEMLFGVFSKKEQVNEVIKTQISETHYKNVDAWKAIYAGYFSDWHDVKYMTVNGTKKRRRHSLNMAKVAANELAKLIFSEKVQINISDKQHNENIDTLLKGNRFYKVFQDRLEQMLALGGLVLKANPKEQPDGTHKLLIGYVTPDCFIPITWENDEITEGAFLTITRKDKKVYCLFEIHRWKITNTEQGLKKLYTVDNTLYCSDAYSNGLYAAPKQVPLSELYPELQEVVVIEGLTKPLFQYIKPNIANNNDLQSPLGISIFANALDTLYAIDVAFDSFVNEFKLGKRPIIVPTQAIRTVIDPSTGEMERYFDADDEVYQAMNFVDPEKQKIVDNTVPLRVEDHVKAINALLNLFCMQTGFSSGTFTFDGVQVKTATEVISENSKTFQTIKGNENVIEEGLTNFIQTLTEVAALYDLLPLPAEGYTVEYYWDDSIIGDKYTDTDWYIKLLQNGLASKKFALMKILELTEEQAEEMLNEINEENAAAMPDLNDMLNNVDPLNKVSGDN